MIEKPTERSAGTVRFATFNLRMCSPSDGVQPGDVVGGTDP